MDNKVNKNSGIGRLASVVHSSSILFEAASEVIGERGVAESFMVLVGDFDLYRVGRSPLSVNEAVKSLIAMQGFTERTARLRFERLLDLRLIEVKVDSADRRRRLVYLSDSGASALLKINDLFEERIRDFYEMISASSSKNLVDWPRGP